MKGNTMICELKFIYIVIYIFIVENTNGYIPKEVILNGRGGRFFRRPNPKYMNVKDYEEYANMYMDRHARDYFSSGASGEQTLRDNENAYKKYRIRPRLLRDVSHRTMNLTLLGDAVTLPIGLSPVALQKMAHPDGEIASARAIGAAGGVMILSMLSTTALEDLPKASGAIYWLQVYIANDRDVTKTVIKRADAAGFKAIVVTVDSPVNGMWGVNMVHNLTLPTNLKLPNLQSKNGVQSAGSNLRGKVQFSLLDPSLTWKDIQWIQTFTALPIVVKGVLTAEDAVLAVENGASAILVSNHGGRQLDGVSATLEALPEIVRAVKGHAEVYVDGGARSGSDVFKALALGARAVFIGRPIIWGLVHNGQEGVKSILNMMKNQLDTTMALSGASNLWDIQRRHVAKAEIYNTEMEDVLRK